MKDGEINDRLAARHEVLLKARCRVTAWRVCDAELGNISAGGCSILGTRERFETGQRLSLQIANLKPITGHVTWVREEGAGLEFTEALTDALIATLNADFGLDVACGGRLSDEN